jgi:hypothetical protein
MTEPLPRPRWAQVGSPPAHVEHLQAVAKLAHKQLEQKSRLKHLTRSGRTLLSPQAQLLAMMLKASTGNRGIVVVVGRFTMGCVRRLALFWSRSVMRESPVTFDEELDRQPCRRRRYGFWPCSRRLGQQESSGSARQLEVCKPLGWRPSRVLVSGLRRLRSN